MKPNVALWGLLALGLLVASGCHDNTPPPERAAVPAAGDPLATMRPEPMRPLPDQARDDLSRVPLPFDDVPLVNQRPPEERSFVEAYQRVGRPKIAVFVNRTLEGNILPVNPPRPLASVEYTRGSNAPVDIERKTSGQTDSRWSSSHSESSDRFSTTGPAEYRETLEVYLQPGEYDDAWAKSLDYQAMENILTDWLSASGQVTVMSPLLVRQRLTDQQVAELQSGRPQVMSQLAQQLDADVLVQVQAHPTRQTREGLTVRLVAEAINIRGGQSIGRAVVDVPPPLEKVQLNKYTRFVARKLMDGMIGAWMAPPPEPRSAAPDRSPNPASQPVVPVMPVVPVQPPATQPQE